MSRIITLAAALMVLVAGFAVVAPSQAEAGFRHRNKCCKPAKKCRTPRRLKKDCCEPACCEAPEPTCCEAPAPTCCEAPAPTCCEAPAPSCCEAAPACGCEAESSCCLSRREKRKARKNCCVQTCGCEAPACDSCSAQVSACSSCGSAAPAVEGCSDCGGDAVEAPTPAAEAAPEAPAAPEGDSTT